MLFSQTITVYNHYKDSKEDKWTRTVLTGCQIKDQHDKYVGTDGHVHFDNYYSITIDYSAEKNKDYTAPLSYKGKGWTLYANNLDMIVAGECTKEITDDYDIDDLAKDYGALAIQSVHDNTARDYLKTWKVICK